MDAAIIDYQMGNLHSVQAACAKVGMTSKITSNPDEILNAKIAILPGVGAFGEAMNHLNDSKLTTCIKYFIESGKPFVGICLGLQLLFESSEEFGSYKGLGLIKGKVKKFIFKSNNKIRYPVPQIGWNQINSHSLSWDNTFLCKNRTGDFMYFVHSYYVEPEDEKMILSKTTYGDQSYCSAIKYKNIFATQFHPEKSGCSGIKIYEKIKEYIK